MGSEAILSGTFLILRIIRRNIIITAHTPSCEILTVLFRLEIILEFFDIFSKISQISKFYEFSSGESSFSKRTVGKTDGYTEPTNLILSFRSLVNALETGITNMWVGTSGLYM